MSDEPNRYLRALAEEYRMCVTSGQHGRILSVVEQLTLHGWSYDDRTDQLVRIKERAVVRPQVETPEKPAPRRSASRKEG